jgi:predicted dehydrogenase
VAEGAYGVPMAYALRDDQFWPTGAVVPGHSDWRSVRAEAGGGALLEHSIHSCDVVSWLFGPARRVHATTRAVFGYDVEDVAALTIEHESGVVGTLLTVFNGVRAREERRLEIFLEQASIEITTNFIIGAPEDSFLIHEAHAEDANRLDVSQLRRDTFAADGCDPDRLVFVYQATQPRQAQVSMTRSVPTRSSKPVIGAPRPVNPSISRGSTRSDGPGTRQARVGDGLGPRGPS